MFTILFLLTGLELMLNVFAASKDTSICCIAFVIISQNNGFHDRIALMKKENITNQIEALKFKNDHVYIVPNDFPDVLGYWTIMPLFDSIVKFSDWAWVFFLEETTLVDVKKLHEVVSKYDYRRKHFLGYALKDVQSTIIHHFDSVDDLITYPHFSAGFLLSRSLVEKVAVSWKENYIPGFSIDAKYELAKFLLEHENSAKLKHEPRICLIKTRNDCASWIPEDMPNCANSVSTDQVFFAVKTCHKYHKDRVQVVKTTWAHDAELIAFFSDVRDTSIPTIDLGVENVATGHCEKTLAIIEHVSNTHKSIKWLVIVDDDTLISIPRLQKLLACYKPLERVALGEKYGYKTTNYQGYDYITGGGGIVFSMPLVKEITLSCACPSVDSPDDMILGMCLRELGVPIIHSHYFHQARPEDYSTDYINNKLQISFHKHWLVDPHDVYNRYLNESSQHRSLLHTEL